MPLPCPFNLSSLGMCVKDPAFSHCTDLQQSMWVVLLLCIGCSTAAAGTIKGRCHPQGLLILDKPYPPPRRVELPFCQQVRLVSASALNSIKQVLV